MNNKLAALLYKAQTSAFIAAHGPLDKIILTELIRRHPGRYRYLWHMIYRETTIKLHPVEAMIFRAINGAVHEFVP